MAAPSATSPQDPSGTKLDHGFRTRVVFSSNPTVALWLIEAELPEVEGGDPIDNTDMHNLTQRTKRLRKLIERMNAESVWHYAPKSRAQIDEMINREQTVTYWLSDGSSHAFYGGITNAKYSKFDEENDPRVTLQITETDWDPVNDVEAGPVTTEVAGT